MKHSKGVDRAIEELLVEVQEAATLMRMTHRRLRAVLDDGNLTPRELTQVLKGLNGSIKAAPALINAISAASAKPQEAMPILTADDIKDGAWQ